jgi:hypothetical protein
MPLGLPTLSDLGFFLQQHLLLEILLMMAALRFIRLLCDFLLPWIVGGKIMFRRFFSFNDI